MVHTMGQGSRFLGVVACVLFLFMSVAADAFTTKISASHKGTFLFDPACMVILVEMCKLMITLLILLYQRFATNRTATSPAPSNLPLWVMMKLTILPAALYAASNILNFYGIAW